MTAAPGRPPSIAAVIVNYNYADYLPDAVESVLRQGRPFDEVVVVNDGSTDDSLAVLERYHDVVKVLDIPNAGQLGACRAGLAATSSDYVYFLDADDFVRADLVATVLSTVAAEPVKVQFQLEAVNAALQPGDSVFPTFPDGYDAAGMRSDNTSIGFYVCPPTSGNAYRRDTLLALPLADLDQRDFIDGPATLALPYLGEVVSIREPLACYRLHGRNASQWAQPTVELLSHEIEWFGRRWEQACMLAGLDAPPFQPGRPLYVVERELMIAALQNSARTPALAAGYARRLLATGTAPRHQVMLLCWAAALCLPLRRLRRRMVLARRSPLNRSGTLRRLVRLLSGRPGR